MRDKTALISGGDSGIGRAAAIAFAKEGADVAILYLEEHGDASETAQVIKALGRRCLKISGDVGEEQFCKKSIEQVVREFGHLDILVNNAAEQRIGEGIEDISSEQLQQTRAPREPFLISPDRWPANWPQREFASTPWRRGRFGRR